MSNQPSDDRASGWLLLIHQLPAEPAYLRVKISRRLKALGAVALKNSIYVLPDGASTREDFQWLRREILDGGGEATLASCAFLQGTSDHEMAELFRAERNDEYGELVEAVGEAIAAGKPGQPELDRFRRRLQQIRQRDHFEAPQRASAENALRMLARGVHGEPTRETDVMETRPRGATWVTRTGVFVDRMASAWLIRRFIDPQAEFKFVPADGYEPEPGELRFDMYEGEYSHEGDRCSFETLMLRFGLEQPGLEPIAQIVHEIDCKDDKFGRPETPGIASVLAGIVAAHGDDHERLAASAPLFDGLLQAGLSPG